MLDPGNRTPRHALAAIFLTALASCSSVPDYAHPTGEVMQPDSYSANDVIPYRELTRADFRAASPPKNVAQHASKLGAYTCALIVPASFRARSAIARDPASGGYIARIPGAQFRAEMDRECSWWNPKSLPAGKEYILQHEQIHFAIVELHARRMEADVAKLRGTGSSPQAAAEDMQRALDSAFQEAMERVLEQSTRFDEQTSYTHDPSRQARWADEIFAQLQ